MKNILMMLVPKFSTDWAAFKVAEWDVDEEGDKYPKEVEVIALVKDLTDEDPKPDLIAYVKNFSWLGFLVGKPIHGAYFDFDEWLEFAIENGIIEEETE